MTPLRIATPDDRRGMQSMQAMTGRDPLPAAALLLLVAQRRLVVATGFPVKGRPETDGPPGAIALLRALHALGSGRGLALASWRDVLDLVAPELPSEVELVEIPRAPAVPPRVDGACIAIECCGTLPDGRRLDMRGRDIAGETPCFEDAFGDRVLLAIGDGGNEVGMGAAPAGWHERFGVARPRSTCEVLVPASVSNWGALALVATLGALSRVDLLPEPAEHVALVERLVARGAVDGFTGEPRADVDGRPATDEGRVVAALRAWWSSQG